MFFLKYERAGARGYLCAGPGTDDHAQIPCNIVLKRTTPRFWLPTMTLAWGVVTTLHGLVQDTEGFYIARFFLGIAESGLFPGVLFYLSMWYADGALAVTLN